METPSLENHNIEMGLKDLTLSLEKHSTPNNPCIMPSINMLSPPNTPNADVLGDYIGMESCFDLKNNEEVVYPSNSDVYSQIRDRRDQRLSMKKKEFPPLISLLAHTEHLASHMPWVLKREYTSDGRLILTEERVKHHEYLQAHRSDGRLTLQFVHLDDDEEEDIENDNADEEGYIETEVFDDGDNGDSVNEVDNNYDINVEEEIVNKHGEELEGSSVIPESSSSMENGKSGISNGGNGGAVKCLNYNSVRTSSSCFLGMPVPAIRPVHT